MMAKTLPSGSVVCQLSSSDLARLHVCVLDGELTLRMKSRGGVVVVEAVCWIPEHGVRGRLDVGLVCLP